MKDNEESFLISEEDAGKRLDVFLVEQTGASRAFVQRSIEQERALVNGKASKSNHKLRAGDVVSAVLIEDEPQGILPEDIPLDVVYEDDDVIVINKTRGMVVHPAPGHYSGTVVNALLFREKGRLSDLNGKERPGIVHRIDADTTGLIVCAKTNIAHESLAAQLEAHSTVRKYEAICYNAFREEQGTVNKPIARGDVDRKKMVISPKGREAVTHYKVIENMGKFAHIECVLETGRTHQIRVHMKSIGHPLLGDKVYTTAKAPFNTDGQMLHAGVLGFEHPVSGEYLEFRAEPPEDFQKALKLLRQLNK